MANIPTFRSYNEYKRWDDRRIRCADEPLPQQRQLLAAIVYAADGEPLVACLQPEDFDRRNTEDWQQSPATHERIAVAALAFWEEHGRPPGQEIATALAGDKLALSYLPGLQAAWQRCRAEYGRQYVIDELVDIVKEHRREIAERASRPSPLPRRRDDRIQELADAGRTQTEIARLLGISQTLVSKTLSRAKG